MLTSSFELNANELNSSFLESIKELFKNKKIEIVISEIDETEYLNKSENNRKRLLEAIENIKNNENLVEVDLKDFEWKK